MQEEIQKQILDSCLLSLVDNHEGPERNIWITLNYSPEEFEQVREFAATQVAHGWFMPSPAGNAYRLTREGYLKHLPRAKALRAMGGGN
jgi:hypothetical protein